MAPHIWLDATCVKARRGNHVVLVSVIVAVGVNTDGSREVLGMMAAHSEAGPFWVNRRLGRSATAWPGAACVGPSWWFLTPMTD